MPQQSVSYTAFASQKELKFVIGKFPLLSHLFILRLCLRRRPHQSTELQARCSPLAASSEGTRLEEHRIIFAHIRISNSSRTASNYSQVEQEWYGQESRAVSGSRRRRQLSSLPSNFRPVSASQARNRRSRPFVRNHDCEGCGLALRRVCQQSMHR